jgi:hypothetical protein
VSIEIILYCRQNMLADEHCLTKKEWKRDSIHRYHKKIECPGYYLSCPEFYIVPCIQFRRVKFPLKFFCKPMRAREMLLTFLQLEV